MFIALCSTTFFSPVNQRQIRVWYLAGRNVYRLVIVVSTYRPYGTKEGVYDVFYKHIVPTGLKCGDNPNRHASEGFLEQEIFS